MENHFTLFGNCILVKGFTKSAIFDLSRGVNIEIPNLLFDILKVNDENKFSISALKEYFKDNYSDGIDKYFNLLHSKKLGFFTDLPSCFPRMELNWDSPSVLTTAIVEHSKNSPFDIIGCLNQLEELGCKAIELRFTDDRTIQEVIQITEAYNQSRISNMVLVLKYYEGIINDLKTHRIFEKNHRVALIYIYGCQNKNLSLGIYKDRVIMSNESHINNEHTKEKKFILNIKSFSEAKNYNLFFNRKIFICSNGKIKNHITHSKEFGNVNELKIKEVILEENFQKIWFLNNDKIEKCKDCQYRYVCLDDSEIIERDNLYFKTNDCSYNPYSDTWN